MKNKTHQKKPLNLQEDYTDPKITETLTLEIDSSHSQSRYQDQSTDEREGKSNPIRIRRIEEGNG